MFERLHISLIQFAKGKHYRIYNRTICPQNGFPYKLRSCEETDAQLSDRHVCAVPVRHEAGKGPSP